MKKRAALAALVLASAGACWGADIDVGTSAPEANDGTPPNDAVAEAGDASMDAADVVSPLGQCGVSGQVDRYFTAAELSARIVGRWGQCPGVEASPLPCPPKTKLWGIRFSADGTFSLLGADSETSDYVDQPDLCGRGTYRFRAPAPEPDGGTDGGDAGGEYVPFDDTKLRNGLEVHLFTTGGTFDVELVEFEKAPERMFLREQGPLDSRGYFARLPAAPR